MKQKTRQLAIGMAAVSAIFLLSGCWPFPSGEEVGKKIMEKAIESQTGGEVNVDTDKETMSINTKDGSFSAGKDVKVPDGFSKDIFMFSDAKVMFAMSGISGEKSYSISYLTATTPEEAFAKYKEEMSNKNWQKESEIDMGAQGKMMNFKKDKLSAMVTIGINEDEENKGKTQIGIISVEDSSSNAQK